MMFFFKPLGITELVSTLSVILFIVGEWWVHHKY